MRSSGAGSQGELGDQYAALGDLRGKLGLGARVDDVDSGAEHGDGRARAAESAAMRRGVDAEREARDDRQAGIAQRARETFGVSAALSGAIAAADYGDCRPLEQIDAAMGVEQRRRIGDFEQ